MCTSSGEKKATASGSMEPAGCKDTTALKTDGISNSMTAILSAAQAPNDPGLRLFDPWKLCSREFSFREEDSEGALSNQSNRSKVKISRFDTSFSKRFKTSGNVLTLLTSSLQSNKFSSEPQCFFEGVSLFRSPSSR